MAGVIYEKLGRETMEGADPNIDPVWIADGAADEAEVSALISANVPGILNGLVVQNYRIKQIGDKLWEIPFHYGKFRYERLAEQQSNDAPKLTFNTGGQTQKITVSRGTTKYAPAGQTAPDFKGLIGVTDDGIEGVDVPVPSLSFTYTKIVAMTQLQALTHANAMAAVTGATNLQPWKGFGLREARFDGLNGSERAPNEFELAYGITISIGRTNFAIGTITGINKPGWSYLWVRDKEIKDSTANKLVRTPMAVYVEQVLNEVDFNTTIPI